MKSNFSERCRACGGETKAVFNAYGFEWKKCKVCGCIQKSISREQYNSMSVTYDPGVYSESLNTIEDLKKFVEVYNKKKVLTSLLRDMPKSGYFLDIGCGMGGYLIAANELGFSCKGIEPSISYSEPIKKFTDFDVINSYYSNNLFDVKFNVVMLSHVIEHIYDPKSFLEEILCDLEKDGCIIVITPNSASLSANLASKYWSMYKPVDHITMMTKDSLQRICPKNATLASVYTSEWPGEFAAHSISAMKTFWKTRNQSELDISTETFVKKNVRQSTLSPFTQSILGFASFPWFGIGKMLDKQSCCYAVYKKS